MQIAASVQIFHWIFYSLVSLQNSMNPFSSLWSRPHFLWPRPLLMFWALGQFLLPAPRSLLSFQAGSRFNSKSIHHYPSASHLPSAHTLYQSLQTCDTFRFTLASSPLLDIIILATSLNTDDDDTRSALLFLHPIYDLKHKPWLVPNPWPILCASSNLLWSPIFTTPSTPLLQPSHLGPSNLHSSSRQGGSRLGRS